jgi:hypothetical protein
MSGQVPAASTFPGRVSTETPERGPESFRREHTSGAAPTRGAYKEKGRVEPGPGKVHHELADEDQKREPAEKKMLKMKVDPTMLLKTKGRKTADLVLASIFMKTGSLLFQPIC